MQLTARLFNATIVADDGAVPVWDPSVRFFRVYRDGQPKGHLYVDPYARPGGEHRLARGSAVPQLPSVATYSQISAHEPSGPYPAQLTGLWAKHAFHVNS